MGGSDAGDCSSRGSARRRLDGGCSCLSSEEEAEKGYDIWKRGLD